MIISSDHSVIAFIAITSLCIIALAIAAEREARFIVPPAARVPRRTTGRRIHLWRIAGVLIVGVVSVAGWSMLFQILKA